MGVEIIPITPLRISRRGNCDVSFNMKLALAHQIREETDDP